MYLWLLAEGLSMRNRMYVIFALAILATVIFMPPDSYAGGRYHRHGHGHHYGNSFSIGLGFVFPLYSYGHPYYAPAPVYAVPAQLPPTAAPPNNPRILQTGKKQHIAGNIRKIFWSMVKKRCPMGPPASRMMVDGGLLTDPLFN